MEIRPRIPSPLITTWADPSPAFWPGPAFELCQPPTTATLHDVLSAIVARSSGLVLSSRGSRAWAADLRLMVQCGSGWSTVILYISIESCAIWCAFTVPSDGRLSQVSNFLRNLYLSIVTLSRLPSGCRPVFSSDVSSAWVFVRFA